MEEPTTTEACCSFAITGDRPFIQDVYVCRTCCPPSEDGAAPSALLGLCQSCATVCHKDHDVYFLGTGKSYCDCSQIQHGCRIAESSQAKVKSLWPEDDEGDRMFHEDTGSPQKTQAEHDIPVETTNLQEEPDDFIRDAFMVEELSRSKQDEEYPLVELLETQASELIRHSKDTFWIDFDTIGSESASLGEANDQTAIKLCSLERLACHIAQHHLQSYHVSSDKDDTKVTNNPQKSSWKGLEWWVQVKTIQPRTEHDTDKALESESVDLHYDKDEVLAEVFGLGIFPTLSTVTYLTGDDASQPQSPTIVFPRCYHDNPDDGDMLNMWISQPRSGKHVVFDGRLLHGAPSHQALRRRANSAEPLTARLRITFLVNLWKSHRPAGITSLPDGIRQKLLSLESDSEGVQSTNLSWAPLTYETLHIEKEPEGERIPLPFVSNSSVDGGIDVDEDDQEKTNGMVVMAYAPDDSVEETALLVYAKELGAYFQDDGEEEEEEDDEDDDDPVEASSIVVLDKIKALCESENWSTENEALVCGLLLCTRIESEPAFLDKVGFSEGDEDSNNRFHKMIREILRQTVDLESELSTRETKDPPPPDMINRRQQNESLTRLASQILTRALILSKSNPSPAEFVSTCFALMQKILQLRRKRQASIGTVDIELLHTVQNCLSSSINVGLSKQNEMSWIWSTFYDSIAAQTTINDPQSVPGDHKLMIDTLEALLDQTSVADCNQPVSRTVTWRKMLFESLQEICANVTELPDFWGKALLWWVDLPKSQKDKSEQNQLSPQETAEWAWLLLYIVDACGGDVHMNIAQDAWLPLASILLAVAAAATDHVETLRLLAWTVTCRIWSQMLQNLFFDRTVCSLLKLAAGETKIELEGLLRQSSPDQNAEKDGMTMLRVCSQIICQTVSTISELEDESMSDATEGRIRTKTMSKSSIQNVRHSLENSLDTCVQYFETEEAQVIHLKEVTTIMIGMLGSLLSEFDIFLQESAKEDEDRIKSLVRTLGIAMTLSKRSSEAVCLIFPAMASVLASAQGDDSRISMLENGLDIAVDLVNYFWKASCWSTDDHGSTVPWVCHSMEILYDIKTDLVKADEWKRYLNEFLREVSRGSVSSSAGIQAAAGCYVALQGDLPLSDEEAALIEQALKDDGTGKRTVPKKLCSPFGSYPNPFQLSNRDRDQFAAVVQFPRDDNGKLQYRVLDHTKPWEDKPSQLLSEEDHRIAREKALSEMKEKRSSDSPEEAKDWFFGVGRYDEDRRGMYESELFAVDNPEEQRTVHVGIDLDGPVGTPVYAFYDGKVLSVGYNAPLGDYGNVIVIEHALPGRDQVVYALYGHLDSTVVQNWKVGQIVKKGEVIGGMGAPFENGGWLIAHVHFQLSVDPPETHDLPGAVAPKDRPQALYQYPDPRYILGELY